jgi:hypothetical protein
VSMLCTILCKRNRPLQVCALDDVAIELNKVYSQLICRLLHHHNSSSFFECTTIIYIRACASVKRTRLLLNTMATFRIVLEYFTFVVFVQVDRKNPCSRWVLLHPFPGSVRSLVSCASTRQPKVVMNEYAQLI